MYSIVCLNHAENLLVLKTISLYETFLHYATEP